MYINSTKIVHQPFVFVIMNVNAYRMTSYHNYKDMNMLVKGSPNVWACSLEINKIPEKPP